MRNLLILEAGLKSTREYWLKSLKRQGYVLYLAQPWGLGWEEPYVEDYLKISFSGWAEVSRDDCKRFIEKHNICGVVALNEGTVPFANSLCQYMGLPQITAKDIGIVRNKVSMRMHLKDSGISQPEFLVIDKFAKGDSLPDVSYPVVVKPAEMMASLGVKYVEDSRDLAKTVLAATTCDFSGEDLRSHYGFSDRVLIESYIDGAEYSLESIVQNGNIIDFFVTKKFLCKKPYFDEIAHLANPPLCKTLVSRFSSFLKKLHKVLGIQNSITHTEVKVTEEDEIFLVEIGARPGGDCIPLIHEYSAKVSFPRILANIVSGQLVMKDWSDFNQREQVAVYFPHNSRERLIDRDLLTKKLSGVKILVSELSENIPPIDIGAGTSRGGIIIFSDALDTIKVLDSLCRHGGE